MAITVNMVSDSFSSGTFSATPDIAGFPLGSFTVDYRVYTDSYVGDAATMMGLLKDQNIGIIPGANFNAGYCGTYTPHASTGDYCVSRLALKADKAATRKRWMATATYEPIPIFLPVEILFQTSHYEETVVVDAKTGKAILNGAGEPLAKAIMEAKGRLRLEITKRFSAGLWDPRNNDAAIYHKSAAAISFTFQGYSASYLSNQFYCTDIRSPFLFEPKPHWKVTAAFEVDKIGVPGFSNRFWVRQTLNQGFRFKDSGGKLQQFTAGPGVIHGGQGMLNADGTKLVAGGTPNYILIETIPEYDFNGLHLFPGT